MNNTDINQNKDKYRSKLNPAFLPTAIPHKIYDCQKDYKTLKSMIDNSQNLKQFQLACQELVQKKYSMDRNYYKLSKSFLIIIYLLNYESSERKCIIEVMAKIKNFNKDINELNEDEWISINNDIDDLLNGSYKDDGQITPKEKQLFHKLGLTKEYCILMIGYVNTRRFRFNSHKIMQIIRREQESRQSRINYLDQELKIALGEEQQKEDKQHDKLLIDTQPYPNFTMTPFFDIPTTTPMSTTENLQPTKSFSDLNSMDEEHYQG